MIIGIEQFRDPGELRLDRMVAPLAAVAALNRERVDPAVFGAWTGGLGGCASIGRLRSNTDPAIF